MSIILLVDNGSVRAEATLQLRKLAEKLSNRLKIAVHPVSLKHSNRISKDKLEGRSAQIFQQFMTEKLKSGERKFILLPLFFGNSRAISSFVPDETSKLIDVFGNFELTLADPIYPLPEGEPKLQKVVLDHIVKTKTVPDTICQNIVLVDHGSPEPQVTNVRKHLASAVQSKLGKDIVIEEAVMERRDGKEYDFNGELLDTWLRKKANHGVKQVCIILLFFLPGRHAGKGGDIIDICDQVTAEFPGFNVAISPLISEHEETISILEDRYDSVTA